MKINKNIVGMAAIAAVAFTVGRLELPLGGQSSALAQDQGEAELPPEIQKMMEAGVPGRHHEYLEALIGDFSADVTIWGKPDAEPMKFIGTVSREWILDGRFIKETVKAEGPFGSFEGLGFIGYNNFDGQYESVWMENVSTAIERGSGVYNVEEMTLITIGKHRNVATGKLTTSYHTMDLSDPYRHTSESHVFGPDGETFKNFEGVFVRKQ